MSSRPGGNATPKGKRLLKRNSISRSANSKSNSTTSFLLDRRPLALLPSTKRDDRPRHLGGRFKQFFKGDGTRTFGAVNVGVEFLLPTEFHFFLFDGTAQFLGAESLA